MKPIDFSSRTKTFMSQMTDKTPRFNNTTTTIRNKDFTNTHIDVNVTSDSRALQENEGQASSLDSSLASRDNRSPSKTRMALDAVASARDAAEEDSAVFDDWSDEVSELSGIGNEEKAAMKKMIIGRNARKSKSSRDNRAVSSRLMLCISCQFTAISNTVSLFFFTGQVLCSQQIILSNLSKRP
jgi:hypothetical protein